MSTKIRTNILDHCGGLIGTLDSDSNFNCLQCHSSMPNCNYSDVIKHLQESHSKEGFNSCMFVPVKK